MDLETVSPRTPETPTPTRAEQRSLGYVPPDEASRSARPTDADGHLDLFDGTAPEPDDPAAMVAEARRVAAEEAGQLGLFGVRRDARFRRQIEGGRPALSAKQLNLAVHWHNVHRGRAWTKSTRDTLDELRARALTAADCGSQRTVALPQMLRRLEGPEREDGTTDPLVPRRLAGLVGIVWAAFDRQRFGVYMSNVELAAELLCSERTVRNLRAAAEKLGLIRVDRTWREGKYKRPSDQGRNLLRLGPVLEVLAGTAAGENSPKGGAPVRKGAVPAARRLRKAARVSTYNRVGRIWRRCVAREERRRKGAALDVRRRPSTEAQPPLPRGPRPPAPANSDGGIGRQLMPSTPDLGALVVAEAGPPSTDDDEHRGQRPCDVAPLRAGRPEPEPPSSRRSAGSGRGARNVPTPSPKSAAEILAERLADRRLTPEQRWARDRERLLEGPNPFAWDSDVKGGAS